VDRSGESVADQTKKKAGNQGQGKISPLPTSPDLASSGKKTRKRGQAPAGLEPTCGVDEVPSRVLWRCRSRIPNPLSSDLDRATVNGKIMGRGKIKRLARLCMRPGIVLLSLKGE